MNRAQVNLLALAVALSLVSAAAVVAVAVAGGAFATADRDAAERSVAASVSERLVAADGPLARDRNVLDARALDRLDGPTLRATVPAVDGHDVAVSLDGRPIAAIGDPTDGTTVRRFVLVDRRRPTTLTPNVSANRSIALPNRTDRIDLRIDPPEGTTVTTVRADGRVVLRNESGLRGAFDVGVARDDPARLRLAANGSLPEGSVRVRYDPWNGTPAVLAVSVDA